MNEPSTTGVRDDGGQQEPWTYPEVVPSEQPAFSPGQTFGMVMTAVVERFFAGVPIDKIDPDDTTLNIETCVGRLAEDLAAVAQRLGWIPSAGSSDDG